MATIVHAVYAACDVTYEWCPQPEVALQSVTNGNSQDFFRMNPPEFLGCVDPLVVHDWLYDMEKMLWVMPCSKENKVIFASHMMKGPATRW